MKLKQLPLKNLTENIIEFMQEGLLVLNTQNCIERVNSAALKLFKFSSDTDLQEKHIGEVYAFPEDAENAMIILEEEGKIENWENTFIKANGSLFTGAYSAMMIDDYETSERLKVILIRDITEQKASVKTLADYAQRLEKKNKEFDQFAYIVSHDLKAPLRAISNLALWLEEDLGQTLTGENKNNLTMLRNRVIRMESLINGILEYSRIGRQQMICERLDVSKLLNDILELLLPPPHIKIEIAKTLPVVLAPRVLLLQVFSNLIGNAIKYNDKSEGLIRIYSCEKSGCYEFTVEDNGPGIDSEYHEKIFLIFQTLQSRDKVESSGIGLTIVKKILEERGGKITLESEVGKGSKFIFEWPKIISTI